MLGMCTRSILRSPSKSQLMPNNSFDFPLPPRCEEPKVLPAPAFTTPRLVIGFTPVSQKLDCDESPRSVMEPRAFTGIEKVSSHEKQSRSPRSPRSGLESLLSSPRPGAPDAREVEHGVAGTFHAKEAAAARAGHMDFVQDPISLVSEASFICGSTRFPTPSQPIPIVPTHLQTSSRGKTQLSKEVHEDELQASLGGRGGLISQARDFRGIVDDVVVENRRSIFSTTSPASSCSDSMGDFALVDFLKACFFCKRQLAPGKDIFMYRGDRAFCTAECRYKQIVMDERKERCAAATVKAGAAVASDVPSLPRKVLAATTAAAA